MIPTNEYSEVLRIVTSWPMDQRIALAHDVLQRATDSQSEAESERRRPTFERARGIARASGPAPTDEQIKRWIGECRMEKYG